MRLRLLLVPCRPLTMACSTPWSTVLQRSCDQASSSAAEQGDRPGSLCLGHADRRSSGRGRPGLA